jgi:hypothetical protein
MSRIDELIREALVRQADRRPRPDAVLAVLRERAPRKRHRARALLVSAAAAAVVAAVVASLGVQRFTAPTAPEAGTSSNPPAAAMPSTAPTLRYTLGWVPGGYVEKYRGIGVHDMQLRMWTNGSVNADRSRTGMGTAAVSLSVHAASEPNWAGMAESIASSPKKTTIQGHPAAFVIDESTVTRLVWMPEPNTFLMVYVVNVPESHQVALRLAESVRADGAAQIGPEISFGELPPGLQAISRAVLGNTPAQVISELIAGDPNRADAGAPTVRVVLCPTAPASATGGTPVTVRGRAGQFVAPTDQRGTESNGFTDAELRVQLDDGRWLVISAPALVTPTGQRPTPLTREQLVRIADRLSFGEQSDYSWLGTH